MFEAARGPDILISVKKSGRDLGNFGEGSHKDVNQFSLHKGAGALDCGGVCPGVCQQIRSDASSSRCTDFSVLWRFVHTRSNCCKEFERSH